jgi:hypothetical protein
VIRPNRPAATGGGVHQGVITRVDGTDLYVQLPRVSPDLEYGPCLACEVPTAWAAGQQVLVAFVESRVDEPAIVCRLA